MFKPIVTPVTTIATLQVATTVFSVLLIVCMSVVREPRLWEYVHPWLCPKQVLFVFLLFLTPDVLYIMLFNHSEFGQYHACETNGSHIFCMSWQQCSTSATHPCTHGVMQYSIWHRASAVETAYIPYFWKSVLLIIWHLLLNNGNSL